MAHIKVTMPNGTEKYIKNIDYSKEELELTEDRCYAYDRSSGFYVNSEIDFLKFHFKDKCPWISTARPAD